jgi:ADP-dependent NAD(P)H-hydrate dehydratase / NAD(P)H-hydrate epimerase
MISAYTGTQVREAERPFLEAGMGAVLMNRAAYGLANAVVKELRAHGKRLYGSSVVVLAGKGNNGGDGLFAAALLAGRGMRTTAVLTGGAGHPDALAAFQKARGRSTSLTAENVGELAEEAGSADVVIDAVLGTGAKGGLRGPAAELAERLGRDSTGLVFACDVPSGVDPDTGESAGPVLRADVTVTFGGAKAGLLADPGADSAGRIEVVQIGIETELPPPAVQRFERQDLARLLPRPQRRSHKYSRGVVGVVAGSAAYPGAAVLACRGALAAGAGMVRYLGPPEAAQLVRQACPEVVSGPHSVAEAHVQAWLVGPGTDVDDDQKQRALDAVASGLPTVADAGALPVLGSAPLGPQVVLTPHAGELAALLKRRGTDLERSAIEASTLGAARAAAAATGATVLLKGATTVVAAPSGQTYTQAEGSPWMAAAGSGDVLAGILGALSAQMGSDVGHFSDQGGGEDSRWAAIAAMAASLHGLAGTAASSGGPVAAGRIADALPGVWAGLI